MTKTQDNKTTIASWALYDWANSAFATTVMAGFFPVFFKKVCCAGVDPVTSTARLGIANSISGIFIALFAPVLGAIADRGSVKKKLLILFMLTGVIATTSLSLVAAGDWLLAVIIYIVAIIGFSGGNIFYDAFLPFVASEERVDFVSALGFSLGYLGGGILFAVNVWMTLNPELFGFADSTEAVRISFVSVGIWWFVFSMPILFLVREPGSEKKKSVPHIVREGIDQIRRTFREVRHLKTIFLFLIAYWLYMDGVDTIIRMAVDYGMSIGFDHRDLILALLLTQFVGFPAALGFGYLGGKIGTKRAIVIALSVYVIVTLWGAFIREKEEFFMLAVAIGLVQGGVQALSRSFYSRIIPVDKSAEYFGFYNMIGKFSVVLGPALVGMVALLARQWGFASQSASRIGISSVALLFIAGGLVFLLVDEKKGKEEANYLTGSS